MATRELPRIQIHDRPQLGSRHAARLREQGKLPVVIYGHGQAPQHAWADRKAMTDLLHRHAHVVEVTLDARVEPVLIKDVQWNHLGNQIVHMDLSRVDLNERVTATVEVELIGDAVGLKSGGAYLEHRLTEIEVECLALDIPERVVVDVSNLNIDDTITIGQLTLPAGVTAVDEPDTVVAGVFEVTEEAAAEAAEGTAEPEVIGKKAEEGAAAAPAAGKGEAKAKK